MHIFSEDPGGGGPEDEQGTSDDPGGGNEEEKSSSPPVELFDSTALFHWCRPRSFDSIILVRIKIFKCSNINPAVLL